MIATTNFYSLKSKQHDETELWELQRKMGNETKETKREMSMRHKDELDFLYLESKKCETKENGTLHFSFRK